MKIETKYIGDFLKKFASLVTGAEVEFKSNGLVFEGTDASNSIWNKTVLNSKAFESYETKEEVVFLDSNRLDLLGKLCSQINENSEIIVGNNNFQLIGNTKTGRLVLSEKASDYNSIKGKEWDKLFENAYNLELTNKDLDEIKGFIKSLKPEKISFITENNKLKVKFIGETKGIDAEMILQDFGAKKEKEINVSFGTGMVETVFGLISINASLSLETDKPLRIKEAMPLMTAEYIVAPLRNDE
jgi:hypothetical protein